MTLSMDYTATRVDKYFSPKSIGEPKVTGDHKVDRMEKLTGSYVDLLGPHKCSRMEISCTSCTKTLLCSCIFLVWKDIPES